MRPALVLLLVASACAPALPPGVDVDCGAVHLATDAASLAELSASPAGSCVLLESTEYRGSFTLAEGVHLIGVMGSLLTSDDSAALDVTGGGSIVENLEVSEVAGDGIVVRGDATIGATGVGLADAAALRVDCDDCAVDLRGVTLRDSAIGLFATGGTVRMTGGSVEGHGGAQLASGYGVVASAGADVTLEATDVQGNAQAGVIVDGASTRATLREVRVRDNIGRGLWVQGLRGSAAEPALVVEDTEIDDNGGTGFGAVDAIGIIFVNGRVSGTMPRPLPTDLGTIEEVADGVGLFSSGSARFDGTLVESNARSQILVDRGLVGIIFVNGSVAPAAGQLGTVVQNTTEPVDVPNIEAEGSAPLPFSAPMFELPATD